MSAEVWDGDELLGLASERVGEYIDNLEARVIPLEQVQLWAEESKYGERRIRRLHRWLRQHRCDKRMLQSMVRAYAVTLARYDSIKTGAAMADELAKALSQAMDGLDEYWVSISAPIVDSWTDLLARYDATKEAP